MKRKRDTERTNSSRAFYYGHMALWKRTDAERVYASRGCHKRAAALLCDSTASQSSRSQSRSAEVSAYALVLSLSICTHLEAHFGGDMTNRIAPYATAS